MTGAQAPEEWMLLRLYLLFGDRGECASGSVQDGCIVLCGALDYGSGERIQAKSRRGLHLQHAGLPVRLAGLCGILMTCLRVILSDMTIALCGGSGPHPVLGRAD